MSMSGEIRALAADLKAAGERAEALGDQIVRSSAFRIQGAAQDQAPVDTGNLKNSIFTRTPGRGRAEVVASANYAIYVELGTSRARAQPFLGPAVDLVEPEFYAAVEQIGDIL